MLATAVRIDGAVGGCNHSVWWGTDGARLVDARVVPAADLALGRLDPFDPASVARFPVLKDPSRGYAPGRSLCKLGFPLHRIEPVYDEQANTFTLPAGAVPLPMLPLEGMFARVVNTRAPGRGDGDLSPFIETSTPSLIGQMGGPVFDSQAVVWGIQSHTVHHSLGFQPPAPGGPPGQVEHQFLNTGLAVHAAVIRGVLDVQGIEHDISNLEVIVDVPHCWGGEVDAEVVGRRGRCREVAGNLQFRGVFVADGERGRRYAVYFNPAITNANG